MEPASTLPQELIDDIVDYVPDDEKTQRNLSLVNRSWSHRTRHNLFQTVSFELGGRNCARLNEVLQTNPSLYQHIQTMRIDHDSRYSLQSSSIVGVIDPKQLVNVRDISIHGDMESNLNWGALPAGLRSALYDLLAKPDLTTLVLMDISDIDVSFIGRNRRLKELGLYGVKHTLSCIPSTSSEGPPATHLADEKCSLRSLSVGHCGDALQCLRAAAAIVPQPVVLRVHSCYYDDKMDTSLQLFSCNVETYEITCVPTEDLTGAIGPPLHSGILDLARLPKLKTLNINLHADHLWCLLSRPSATMSSPLVQQLNRLRGTNSLEDIDISLDLDFPNAARSNFWTGMSFAQMMILSDHTWEDLDNTLSDRDAFPKLKRVRIVHRFTRSEDPGQAWSAFMTFFKVSVLQNLNRRCMLEVITADLE
ncbi:hypothetical protein DFP72DRAFT_1166913 [Ephemerocybe angulata]|uniref:F-box domain-containing protein n=1 Tax=Ephemerocybe angulata TaxID=980116 RepID=A0A8H6I8K2_9AGAR|nr:hypothetical protein DFP72DRAFT_1166913 [Tulosesus angulatus]